MCKNAVNRLKCVLVSREPPFCSCGGGRGEGVPGPNGFLPRLPPLRQLPHAADAGPAAPRFRVGGLRGGLADLSVLATQMSETLGRKNFRLWRIGMYKKHFF